MVSPLLHHEEYLKKKRNKKLFRFGAISVLIIFIIGSSSYISYRPSIRISKIELIGGVLITEEEIDSATSSFLNDSYLWLFPKNNFLLYPKTNLEKYLKQTFQRIDTIDIKRKNFDTLVMDITERKPIATWCNGISICYFMDSNSTIFSLAPDFSGDAYFKYYGLISAENPIGMQYLASTTEFISITQFVEKIKNLSLKPTYMIAENKGEFTLVLSSGGKIYFDTKLSPIKTADNLTALLQTPVLSQNLYKLDYIDLRFGNKLFYKLK